MGRHLRTLRPPRHCPFRFLLIVTRRPHSFHTLRTSVTLICQTWHQPSNKTVKPPSSRQNLTNDDKQQSQNKHHDERGSNEGFEIRLDRYYGLRHGEACCSKNDGVGYLRVCVSASTSHAGNHLGPTEFANSAIIPLCWAAFLFSRVI